MFDGEVRSLTRLVTSQDVSDYAEISGDYNPIHVDQEFSRNFIFERKIVHGNLILAFFSGMIARDFPGPGSIIVSQDFRFKKPVFVESQIELQLQVIKYNKRANVSYILATCHSYNNLCVSGVLRVLVPEECL